MQKKQLSNYPVWFDGTNINEAAFCEEFLHTHKILFANNAFFTPEGRITDDLPLRGEIFESLKHYAINNVPRKVTNILEVMKLAAYIEDFPPVLLRGKWTWNVKESKVTRGGFFPDCLHSAMEIYRHCMTAAMDFTEDN